MMREASQRGGSPLGTYAAEPLAGLHRLDLTNSTEIRDLLSRTKVGVVALAGAMTNVDGCESRPALARQVNATAAREVAEACRQIGARLVHFSTDYVFDGRSGPSDEASPPNPVNAYGRTKLEGEREVLRALPGALVLRTCANFGWNRLRSKENSVTWVLNRLRRGDPVPLFTDQSVSPSYTPHVARVAFDLVDRRASGTFHVATRGCLTRFELGESVCDAFGLPRSLLRPAKLADASLVAPRPRMSCLASRALERFPDIPVPTFRDALNDMRRTE